MAKHILVVEDDPSLYQLLHELLGFEGFTVSQPADLGALVPELKANPPDAALIDVNLKGVNGLDLLSQIRGEDSLNNMCVLLCSGLDYREESMKRGANGFLQKPYMPDELVNLLDQHLKD
jgi:DNA-binding response OmpR family regulator